MKIDDLFEENLKELKALSKLKLPINKSTQKLLLSQNLDKRTSYFSIIQMWRGKIIERTFAARNKKIPEYQEVIRRIEGNSSCLVRNMYYGSMSGYRVVWEETKPPYYYFDKKNELDKWYINDKKFYRVTTQKLFTLQNIINCDASLKYCAWNSEMSIADYITIYRQYPEVEMLSKLNLLYLTSNIKILNELKEKKFKKFLIDNLESIRAVTPNSNVLLYCYKHNVNIYERVEYLRINDNVNFLFKNCNYNDRLADFKKVVKKEQIINYFTKYRKKNKEYISPSNYADFIEAVEFLKLDLTQEKNVFPHDFKYWHDFYINQMKSSKNKLIDEAMLKQSIKYQKLAKKINDLVIVFPTCTNDLIKEGEALHHCVGRMSYNEKIYDDESLILFVRKNEKTPLYTMEYDHHKHKILQFYGDHDDIPPKEVVETFNKKWLPKVSRLKFE